jgi:DNA invertase Pin-like site-specific DNA recombinase
MKVAYIRVSTKDQNTARQDEVFKEMGITKIFSEKISGKNANRPELKLMLDYVREGDVLFVESFSRLGRSTRDLIEIVDQLNKKSVQLVSLKEKIDTTTPAGKLMFHIFASLSEFEREVLKQRQKEGIELAKKAGKYKGRKPIPINFEKFKNVYEEWKSGKIKAVEAMKKINLQKSTFYRIVKKYEKNQNNKEIANNLKM